MDKDSDDPGRERRLAFLRKLHEQIAEGKAGREVNVEALRHRAVQEDYLHELAAREAAVDTKRYVG